MNYLPRLQLLLERLLSRMQSAETIDAVLIFLAHFFLFANFCFLLARELRKLAGRITYYNDCKTYHAT